MTAADCPTPTEGCGCEPLWGEQTSDQRHDPTICGATCRGGRGNWVECTCGWTSSRYTTITGAYYSFGGHLTDVAAGIWQAPGEAQ